MEQPAKHRHNLIYPEVTNLIAEKSSDMHALKDMLAGAGQERSVGILFDLEKEADGLKRRITLQKKTIARQMFGRDLKRETDKMSHLSCTTISWLQLAAASFAGLAAVLWLCASVTKTPKELQTISFGDEGAGGEIPELFSALRRQNRLNAAAAICAAIAASLQAFLIYAPSCINLG